MARVTAYEWLDMIDPDLNWFDRNAYAVDFFNDVYVRPAGGAIAEDVLYLYADDGFEDRVLVLGGYGFGYDGDFLYSGVVETLAEVDVASGALLWSAENLAVSAPAVASAVGSFGVGDDVDLFAAALAGGDVLTVEAPGSRLFGSSGDDLFELYASGSEVYGDSGNDWFVRAAGGHVFDGGFGIDTVEYLGPRFSIDVDLRADGVITVASGGAVDVLYDVERVQTTSGAYLFGLDGPQARAAYLLYGGAFDRTPDEGGFLFWTNALQGGLSVERAAAYFVSSPEFVQLYGTRLTDAEFVELLYQNVLGRSGDPQGEAFWNQYLATGQGDRADVLANFTQLPEFGTIVYEDVANGYWVV